jgi:hypothetical protein
MAFTVTDMQELTKILTLHPEWRAEVRRLVLTDELLALPQAVQELFAAEQRTEQRIGELAVAQQRTEERLQRLEASVTELTRVVTVLSKTVEKMQTRLSKVDGRQVERDYIDRAAGYFGNWLRRVRVVWPGELDEALEDRLETMLTTEERNDVLRLDAIVRGKVRQLADQPEVYLAVEASLTIERNDVARAHRRAALLQRLGVRTIPVVAGEAIEAAAQEDAEQNGVAVLQNGYSQGWERALAI